MFYLLYVIAIFDALQSMISPHGWRCHFGSLFSRHILVKFKLRHRLPAHQTFPYLSRTFDFISETRSGTVLLSTFLTPCSWFFFSWSPPARSVSIMFSFRYDTGMAVCCGHIKPVLWCFTLYAIQEDGETECDIEEGLGQARYKGNLGMVYSLFVGRKRAWTGAESAPGKEVG